MRAIGHIRAKRPVTGGAEGMIARRRTEFAVAPVVAIDLAELLAGKIGDTRSDQQHIIGPSLRSCGDDE